MVIYGVGETEEEATVDDNSKLRQFLQRCSEPQQEEAKVAVQRNSKKLRCHFARQGIPDIVISDNVPQFAGEKFSNFASEWALNTDQEVVDTSRQMARQK